MDPLTISLLGSVLGKLALELITGACKDHLKDKLKTFFKRLEKVSDGKKVQLAYQNALAKAFASCLESLLLSIKSFHYSNEELKAYRESLEAFIKDAEVATELLASVLDPHDPALPSADRLRERWRAIEGEKLPDDSLWRNVAVAFRRQAAREVILSDDLRELHSARNLAELRKLIERQGGVKTEVRWELYTQQMLTRYAPVDLANLMPAYADDPGRMVIRDVFVAQHVRENPPPVELPKDVVDGKPNDEDGNAVDDEEVARLHTVYVDQSPRPVLDVIADPGNRLLVLIGEPGSGKSTLMRYLLTGLLAPPTDPATGEPLAWTAAMKGAFPLLIELRDFYAARQSGKCSSFLEYVAYMGKVASWGMDDHAAHDHLEQGPSLVMFDGLDEIFDAADRDNVLHEIAGFSQRYPKAKIVVTSRPVGYESDILRNATFAHHGLQDLTDEQIETFVRGWFTLTFPQQPDLAQQRIDRVLDSARQSQPIRLLAGNPMLLTIMALLAREEELPRERVKFYEKAVEVLCHHWDVNRNLQLPEDRYLNADDKKALLRRVAMRMQTGSSGLKGNAIQEADLEQEVQAFLLDENWHPTKAAAKRAARRVIQQLRERNYILCLRGPHLYGFVHRTFLEYLTATEYVLRFDRQPQQMTLDDLLDLFDTHCRDAEWREVLRLICSQLDEQFVGQIIDRLTAHADMDNWDGDAALPELPLAIWCLSEVRNPSPLEDLGAALHVD